MQYAYATLPPCVRPKLRQRDLPTCFSSSPALRSLKAMSSTSNQHRKSVAVAFPLEDISSEMSVLDDATVSTEETLLLALLGDVATLPLTTTTLDLLARCFDSSARLHPTLNVIPLFPYLSDDIPGRLVALGPPEAMYSYSSSLSTASGLVNELNARLGSPLSLIPTPSPPPQQQQQQHSLLAQTQSRVIYNGNNDVTKPLQFKVVAVGGTFDRLHAGHRLLLAATALVCTHRIFVGITSDKLLTTKKNKELLQAYDVREAAAVRYMQAVNPLIEVTSGPLTDPKIPPIAATQAEFEAIVVSEETVHGAEEINHVRASLGLAPLVIVVVGLIGGATGGGEKLSSTELRAKSMAKRPGAS